MRKMSNRLVRSKKKKKKPDSKEWGLVFMYHLTGLKYLHYGLWEKGLALRLQNIPVAQENYAQMLIHCIKEHAEKPKDDSQINILDVGCGTGSLLVELVKQGFNVDGIVPSTIMAEEAKKNLSALSQSQRNQGNVYQCRLEDFTDFRKLCKTSVVRKYDIILFSESFQYVELEESLRLLPSLLKSTGKIIICDFFKKVVELDKSRFGGGHLLSTFYDKVKQLNYAILVDRDITKQISPTIDLLDQFLRNQIMPAVSSLVLFLRGRHPVLIAVCNFFFRKDFAKVQQKYLSGNRTQESFEDYKSYRLIVLNLAIK